MRAFYQIEKNLVGGQPPPHLLHLNAGRARALRITLLSVGKLGRDPAALLARDYAERASAAGKALALGPVEIIEVEAKKPGKAAEAEVILAAVGEGAYLIACDEHGRVEPSRAFRRADRQA